MIYGLSPLSLEPCYRFLISHKCEFCSIFPGEGNVSFPMLDRDDQDIDDDNTCIDPDFIGNILVIRFYPVI